MNLLGQGKPAFGTFMALKGLRSAQVVARTGLDVSCFSKLLENSYESDFRRLTRLNHPARPS